MPKPQNSRGVKASAEGLKKLEQAKAASRGDDGKPMSQERIAQGARVSLKTVGRFMNGAGVDTDTAYPICKVLGCDPDEVLERTEPGSCGHNEPNPFNYGTAVEPDRFYGRWKARSDIKNRIGARTAQSINIVGLRRMGKTSLLRYVRERIDEFCPPEQKPLAVLLDFQDQRCRAPEKIVEGLRRGIQRQIGQALWEQADNQDAYAVEDGLLDLQEQGYRLIVMIDGFEGITQRLEMFQGWGEDWRSKASAGLLTLVMATKQPLNEIYESLELTSPFHNIFSTTVLGAAEPEDWQQLVKDGFETQRSDEVLNWMDRLAGGWPFLVQMAASLLWQYGDLAEAEAEFLVQAEPHFKYWWDGFNPDEQTALQAIVKQSIPHSAMLARLQRYGLVTADNECFSAAFAGWIQEQRR